MGNTTLQEQYIALCRIVRDKNDTLVYVLSSSMAEVPFRWDLVCHRLMSQQHMLFHFKSVNPTQGWDVFRFDYINRTSYCCMHSNYPKVGCRSQCFRIHLMLHFESIKVPFTDKRE